MSKSSPTPSNNVDDLCDGYHVWCKLWRSQGNIRGYNLVNKFFIHLRLALFATDTSVAGDTSVTKMCDISPPTLSRGGALDTWGNPGIWRVCCYWPSQTTPLFLTDGFKSSTQPTILELAISLLLKDILISLGPQNNTILFSTHHSPIISINNLQ